MSKLQELLGEELFGQVTEKLGKGRTIAVVKGEGADGSWIPKQKFDEVNTELGTAKEQLEARDTQLTELRTAAEGNKELQKQIDAMAKANEQQTAEHATTLQSVKLEHAISLALRDAKVKNPKTVTPLLDTEKLELLADGTVKGLEDQLKGLVESEETSFLFVTENNPLLVGRRSAEDGKGGAPHNGPNPFKRGEHFSLTKQGQILKDNPELAERLRAEVEA